MTTQSNREQLYEMLFQRASEGLVIAGPSGQIELANPRAAEMFGYTQDEIQEINIDDLLPGHLRHKHAQHRSSFASQPRSRPMGIGFDLIGVRKDGSSFPLEISLNHFEDDGELKVMALIMDVTKRKEQEAQISILNKTLEKRVAQRTKELNDSQRLYKLISRNFPDGTINVLDRDLNYIFAEGAEMYRHGITSERLMGKNYVQRLPKPLRPMMEEKLLGVLSGQSEKFEVKNNNQFYTVNAVGLSNEAGGIDRILLVEQNITERKLAEERTKEALEKERQLNELKSRFVSMASHEFRTPLSTVLSSLSLIEKYDQSETPEKKDKHYKRIRSSVRHLTNLLNDFLSIEKVEAGKVNVCLERTDVKSLLADMVDQHNQITKTGQNVHFSYRGNDHFHTDANMLNIICSNLLSNAIKYSNEGKTIDLKAETKESQLTISVKDHGIGIPKDEQDNLFDRFFRARNATNIEGTGLGLSIVSRYVQLLGGTITFESTTYEGSTFCVTLPNRN